MSSERSGLVVGKEGGVREGTVGEEGAAPGSGADGEEGAVGAGTVGVTPEGEGAVGAGTVGVTPEGEGAVGEGTVGVEPEGEDAVGEDADSCPGTPRTEVLSLSPPESKTPRATAIPATRTAPIEPAITSVFLRGDQDLSWGEGGAAVSAAAACSSGSIMGKNLLRQAQWTKRKWKFQDRQEGSGLSRR
jgi:hypothetical protein